MVDDDAVDDVGDVLEGVDDPLEMLEDFPLDDEVDRIAVAVRLEGFLQPGRMDFVGMALIGLGLAAIDGRLAMLLPHFRARTSER